MCERSRSRSCSLAPLHLHLCAGIRQLQLVLLKVALLLGVEVHVHVEFKNLLEPPEDQQSHGEKTSCPAQWMFGALEQGSSCRTRGSQEAPQPGPWS